jgi:hypothetical protein
VTIVFGFHALERMKQREINREEVLDVIRDPEYTYPRSEADHPTTVFVGDRLVVVVEDTRQDPEHGTLEPRVITAHIRDEALK